MDIELERWSKTASNLDLRYKHAQIQLKQERKRLKQAKSDLKHSQEAQAFLQEAAKQVQLKSHNRIAGVVSHCLKEVFKDDPEGAYQFKFRFDKIRGRTQARPVFIRNGHELDPKDECSGGMEELAAFALRIVAILMSNPELRRLVIPDEPFRGISPCYRHLVPQLILALSKKMRMQIIYATNEMSYACGKVIKLTKE